MQCVIGHNVIYLVVVVVVGSSSGRIFVRMDITNFAAKALKKSFECVEKQFHNFVMDGRSKNQNVQIRTNGGLEGTK